VKVSVPDEEDEAKWSEIVDTKLTWGDVPWSECKFVIPDGRVTKKLKFDFTNDNES